MTRIVGHDLIATRCCHALYSTPRYGSMNFMAWANWTDGYAEGSLMPGDGGLRKCQCGEVYLLLDAYNLKVDAGPEIPRAQYASPEDLPAAILSPNKTVELVSRRRYWRRLNKGYRDLYRAHREAEEKDSQEKWAADWHAANPDKRPAWRKRVDSLLFRKTAAPPPIENKPFTFPPYQPSPLQIENMARLLELILEDGNETYGPDPVEVAELYRELGRFDEAKKAIKNCTEEDDFGRTGTMKLIERMIDLATTAPIRYRMNNFKD